MNNVVLIGRLTREPEFEYTRDNNARCKFTLAVDRMRKEDGADFIRITTWGKTAENCDKFLSKGSLCAVQGRINTGSYKNKNGDTVYTTDVIASRVLFLSRVENGYNRDEIMGEDRAREIENDVKTLFEDPKLADTFSMAEDDIPF